MLALDLLSPGRLWLLLVVAALTGAYVLSQVVRARHVVRFTNVELLDSIAPKRPQWRRHVVAGLHLVGLAVGVFALARPYTTTLEATSTSGRIILAFDVSLSMGAEDVSPNRLEVAKEAAKDFITEVDPNVEVGLLSFSAQVRQVVPPTLDRSALERGVDGLELGEGTAIGDAIDAAVPLVVPDDSEDPVGAIVVLSDGETTQGQSTADGAAVAADAGVKVYTIAFGTEAGFITDPVTGEQVPVPVKYPEMAQAAETTGGIAYEAPTRSALRDAYDNIEADLGETLGEPIEMREEQTWAYAAVALAFLAGGWSLALYWLRGLI